MKKVFVLFLIFSPLLSASDKKDAAKIEIILRQQRELEANELSLEAKKDQKEGRFEKAAEKYSKAINLYEKSSASEKRIISKINNNRILLVSVYKSIAKNIMVQAEKESSVELFEKAEKFLLKAQQLNRKVKLQK